MRKVVYPNRMSDQVALDLFIQDFVNTNKLVNQHFDWNSLVNRRWAETAVPRIYEFVSSGTTYHARGQFLALPDGEWYRIELTRPIPALDEHRFDYLKMLSAQTHAHLTVDRSIEGPIYVRLTTRNRGLVNIVFVFRDTTGIGNPYLAA